MKSPHQTKSHIPFVWRTNKMAIILFVLYVTGGLLACAYFSEPLKEQWHSWLHAYITLATFTITITIWYNEKKEAWERHLPKKLNIIYQFNNELFATIKNAPLTSEADIRNWGQSIGQTILNKTSRIDFTGFKVRPVYIDKQKLIVQYDLIIYLRGKIEGIEPGSIYAFNDEGNLIIDVNKEVPVQHEQLID